MFYPQACLTLRVRWEDFGIKSGDIKSKFSVLHILAKRVHVTINDYTQADTFEAEIDYKQFPFDPRCIRALGVTVHMEDMGELYSEDGTPARIVPSVDNTIFQGFADEESLSFDDMKRTVKIEGRDYTSLLVDRPYTGGPVSLEKPVDQVISALLAELEQTQKIEIVNKVTASLPVLSKFYNDKDHLSGKKNSSRNESYWDLIQRIIAQAGLIAYIELDKLVISTPRILYGKENVKRFIYGRNIKKLEFKRKIGRRKNFNIIVRSMNLETKEVLEAKIPAEATAAWSTETEIPVGEVKIPDATIGEDPEKQANLKTAPYISFRVTNVNDKAHLIEVGQNIYEELGRQQLEGSLDTADMLINASIPGKEGKNNQDEEFNILKLRNGTPISIWIDSEDLKNILQFDSRESRENYLKARNLSSSAARYLAENIGRYDSAFYTKSASFSLEEGNGFECKVEFINFIKVSNPNVAGAGS